MADLSEYLGHLVCEITRSRVMADRETVRLAQEYASDAGGLLRHFPVPRMRLPSLELTLPVVVSDIPDGYVEVTSTDPKRFAVMLFEQLGPALAKHSIKIDLSAITKIIMADPMLSQGRLAADLADSLSARIFEQVRDAEQSGGKKPKDPPPPPSKETAERFAKIAGLIRAQISKFLEALPRRPAGISIDGRSAAVKHIGDIGMVVNIKMIITEEAMEILLAPPTDGDNERPRISKLVPE